MVFKKMGDATVEKILCSCGAELAKGSTKCSKCGKDLINPALQTLSGNLPQDVPPKP